MKHVPSCRTAALITAATGTVLVTTAFGVLPATAATTAPEPVSATTVSSSSAPDSTVTEPAAAAPTAAAAPAAPVSTDAGSTAAVPAAPATTAAVAPAAAVTPAPDAATAESPAAESAEAVGSPAAASSTSASSTAASSAPAAVAPTAAPADATPAAAAPAPSYAEGTSADAPRVLDTVRAGVPFRADLRATDAEDATYTLTTVEGTDVALNEGLTFSGGVLEGTATYAGTFTMRVTATTAQGTATQWVRQTVEPAATVQVGVVVHGVPAASDGSYTWISPDGSASPGPIEVPLGGSITLVPWTIDEYGNPANATDRAEVWSSGDDDVVTKGADGFTIRFPHASTHTVWVTVDGVCTEFTLEVVEPTPTEPTTPTTPTTPTMPEQPSTPEPPVVVEPPVEADPVDVDPVDATPQDAGTLPVVLVQPTAVPAALAPVAAPTHRAAAHELAYTGADTTTPIGWAAGLLAAGAALVGLRRVRRSRHRA